MASQKYNILYGRLSQEDERQGESNSIHNQNYFLKSTRRTTALTTPSSSLMMATRHQLRAALLEKDYRHD
jgi:hypothetical protein